jgi:hypothetical protein
MELTVAKKIAKKERLFATNVQNSVKNFFASNFNVQISPRNSFFRQLSVMNKRNIGRRPFNIQIPTYKIS